MDYKSAIPPQYTLHFACIVVMSVAFSSGDAIAQPAENSEAATTPSDDAPPIAPQEVDVEPTASDEAITRRLERILQATDWFESASARVNEGVVFLEGATDTEDHRDWAGQLARNTEDVVAVVNQIRVVEPSMFDFSPAWQQMRQLARDAIQGVPTLIVSLTMMVLAWWAAAGTSRVADHAVKHRVANGLLRGVLSKAIALPVLLVGAYLALQVSGLTRLAATVLGGTGLIGIVIGIAFRDIAENFLASVLISVQRPFQVGDLVTIDGKQGYIQGVTTRGTQLMTLDGNHLQIPNAIVYKSVIENASANPNLRLSFVVGIDYGDSSSEAQECVLRALQSHEAVLADPEPLVLVEELASSTVNLQVYFWINGEQHSPLKARSAVLRRVKQRLQSDGFTLPDESREMIFPQGVPVRITDKGTTSNETKVRGDAATAPTAPASTESDDTATEAEGGLLPEKRELDRQASHSRQLNDGANLLPDNELTDSAA